VVCRGDVSRQFTTHVNALITAFCDKRKGERCLMDLVAMLQEQLPALFAAEAEAVKQKAATAAATAKAVRALPVFLREWIWFHHMYRCAERFVLRVCACVWGRLFSGVPYLQQDETQDDLRSGH
jgi:hypothetical protein